MKKVKSNQKLPKKTKPTGISFLLKLAVGLFLISYFNISNASNYAQGTKLSLSFKDVSLKKVLKEIEKQS